MSISWSIPLPRDVGVVIVAAGRGTRLGGDVPKQYLPLGGQPVLLHAMRPFTSHPEVACTVVVLPPGDASTPPAWLESLLGEALRVVPGGASRCESVAAGLAALPASCRIVLVHDGARPFAPRDTIDAGIASARHGHGAVPALPVSDTIKRADDFGRVIGTVSREGLWRAQTPQAFPRDLLARGHQADAAIDCPATDDAMLVELVGGAVDLIPGSARNLKITTADDLAMAEWLLGRP
jgi:2-C-methyl-D-erythritol 4-phosphate cytidylyltransferase